jgi:alkylation response protein AidB-like acyl-CoA dehydrogenase
MEFRFTQDQNELRTQARRFLAAESTAAHVDKAMKTELGYDAAVWQRVATELGWPALVIPEAQDGIGLGPLDLHPLLEEMGRHVFCSPFFGTVCLGANALLVAGTEAQKQAHLPGIAAAGETTATLGYRGPDVAAHREGADAVTLRAAEDRRRLHADRRRGLRGGRPQREPAGGGRVDRRERRRAGGAGPVRAAGGDRRAHAHRAAHHGPDAAPREPAL